jgi:predicted Zn-ribbon and HTH transcriptional regulator
LTKEVRTDIENAVRTYNRFRSPEVTTEIAGIEKDNREFTLLFKGSFCRTCGFHDYFEDFVYELLDEAKIKTKILSVGEEWETETFRVTYVIQE